ncbi:MAG: hypothetical protein RLZZ326_2729, partial [Planctomycetota bacterium]
MQALQFVGVPALPVNEAIRKVIEQAWFEHRSLVIRYQAARGEVSTRTIRID